MKTSESVSTEQPRAEAGHGDVNHVACFSVRGHADPGLLPRVASLWAKRGLTPMRWHSAVCGTDDCELYIDVEMLGLDTALANQIASELRQIWGISQVLMSVNNDLPASSETSQKIA